MGEINNDSCEQYIPGEKAPLASPRRQSYFFLSRPALFHQAQHNQPVCPSYTFHTQVLLAG